MKIEKYTKLKGNKYNVLIDGVNTKLYDDVIVKFMLLRKKDISNEEYDEIVKYNGSLEAYYKGLKYLSIKLRTEKEMYEYLIKTYESKVVVETIKRLKSEGYLNKEVYLKCYLDDALILSNSGPNKIRKDLGKLGFNDTEIDPYLNDIKDDIWLSRLDKVIGKKVNSKHNYGCNKLRLKILNDCMNLGYYKWMVEDVLNNYSLCDCMDLVKREFDKLYSKLSCKYSDYELRIKITQKLLAKGFNYDDINKCF